MFNPARTVLGSAEEAARNSPTLRILTEIVSFNDGFDLAVTVSIRVAWSDCDLRRTSARCHPDITFIKQGIEYPVDLSWLQFLCAYQTAWSIMKYYACTTRICPQPHLWRRILKAIYGIHLHIDFGSENKRFYWQRKERHWANISMTFLICLAYAEDSLVIFCSMFAHNDTPFGCFECLRARWFQLLFETLNLYPAWTRKLQKPSSSLSHYSSSRNRLSCRICRFEPLRNRSQSSKRCRVPARSWNKK